MKSYLRCFDLCFLGLLFWWKLLRCFFLCFKCLEFFHKKKKNKNYPNNLNIYTTHISFFSLVWTKEYGFSEKVFFKKAILKYLVVKLW